MAIGHYLKPHPETPLENKTEVEKTLNPDSWRWGVLAILMQTVTVSTLALEGLHKAGTLPVSLPMSATIALIGVGMLGVILRLSHNHRIAQATHKPSSKHVLLPLMSIITVAMVGLTAEGFRFHQEIFSTWGILGLLFALCCAIPVGIAISNNENVAENCLAYCA